MIEMDDVRAAKSRRRKKDAEKKAPIGILLKTWGRVINTRPGPPPGSMEKANTAGNTTKPARIAMRVSKPTTVRVLVVRFSFFDR